LKNMILYNLHMDLHDLENVPFVRLPYMMEGRIPRKLKHHMDLDIFVVETLDLVKLLTLEQKKLIPSSSSLVLVWALVVQVVVKVVAFAVGVVVGEVVGDVLVVR
jgi:hypothetical protein